MNLRRIGTIMMSPSKLTRGMRLLLNFDAKWYAGNYPDIVEYPYSPFVHYFRHGIFEGRRPSAKFHAVASPVSAPPKKALCVITHDKTYLDQLHNCDDLSIFFNVSTTSCLSGGMLSIDRFAALALELAEKQSGMAIAISGVPLEKDPVTYPLFQSSLPMTHFAWIVKNTLPKRVRLLLPECFAHDFISSVLTNPLYRHWLKERPKLEIIILNQNNQLMPDPQPFVSKLKELTKDIKISTAHPRYCTSRLAIEYGLPVKQLTPLLPKMQHRTWVDRKPIFMISPDTLNDTKNGLNQNTVIEHLKTAFPELEFIIINNMKVQDYLDLASHVSFSLTFGEGMDGYFIEPVLSGGVSFAVYNDVFFPSQFKDAPTVAANWPDLLNLIEAMIPRLQTDPEFYDQVARELKDRLDETYSLQISKRDLKELFEGHIDHHPVAKVKQTEIFNNIKTFLEDERGFRFHNNKIHDNQVVMTSDGLLVQHLGAEFYSVLYEIYERLDYDMMLDPEVEYVLIDIGANVGIASLYLCNKHPNIKEVYAYEPLHPVAEIAHKNFVTNVMNDRINIKAIGLSNRFETTNFEYYKDWTTAFSTDNQFLDSFLRSDEGGARTGPLNIEIEIVPVDVELAEIIQGIGNKRLLIKCDTQGSEFAIFDSLDASGQLSLVDSIVVESHFEKPDRIIDILSKNGFIIDARLDSSENCVYTIKATRLGSIS